MRKQVAKMLHKRIPIMQDTQYDEDEDEKNIENKDGAEVVGGAGGSSKVLDTVSTTERIWAIPRYIPRTTQTCF